MNGLVRTGVITVIVMLRAPPVPTTRKERRTALPARLSAMTRTLAPAARTTAAALLSLGLLAGCATTESEDESAASGSTDEATSDVTEAAALTPRLVVTYDGGVQVLDANTLDVVGDVALDGFLRANPAGDGRHAALSTSEGFQLLDTGTWAQAHGDHAHYFTADPVLTDVTYEAETPGHAVVHAGRTNFWDDGTGEITIVDAEHVADGPGQDARTYTTPAAHHGVAVELTDGTLVLTDGTEDERSGVRVLDADDAEIAATDECPSVHGEATAQGEAVVLGCEDGVVIVKDGAVTKVDSPTSPGGFGTLAGSHSSSVVLGDYKEGEDQDPTQVSLIDAEAGTIQLVELPASYTFRSLARGDDGEALVLGTDGALHVIDPTTGELTNSWPVVDAWTVPEDWQEPRPAIWVNDGTAFVSDPATSSIHAVDILSGEVWNTATLDVVPNELTGVTGDGVEEYETNHDEDEHADHDHEDHDH